MISKINIDQLPMDIQNMDVVNISNCNDINNFEANMESNLKRQEKGIMIIGNFIYSNNWNIDMIYKTRRRKRRKSRG